MKNENRLPEPLALWAERIEATRRPFIRLQAVDRARRAPAESRLGGLPYWPADRDYPLGANEAPLHLLIQINFAEAPPLPPLPKKGLLQIFIADDPLYGMDYQFPKLQQDFRVVFHPDPEGERNLLRDLSFLSEPEDFPMSWGRTFALEFEGTDGPAPPDEAEFDRRLGENFFHRFGDDKWTVQSAYRRYAAAGGHKLGGYAHFPQEDPREEGQTPFLLLQLDSDAGAGLNWGDRGTAHFFIDPADLLELNFDGTVFYSWSSY